MSTSHEVQGRTITLPLEIADAEASAGVFTADADAVAVELPPELRPVTLLSGRAIVALVLVRYHDNPLGDYDEGVVGVVARPAGRAPAIGGLVELLRGNVGLWVMAMPVSQAFTREAGETVWGYPKTHDDLELTRTDGAGELRWSADGSDVLRLSVDRPPVPVPVPPVRAATWTHRDGVLVRTALRLRLSGLRVGRGGARHQLGDHPTAHRLAALDLGRRAIVSASVDHAAMTFEASQPHRPPGPDG